MKELDHCIKGLVRGAPKRRGEGWMYFQALAWDEAGVCFTTSIDHRPIVGHSYGRFGCRAKQGNVILCIPKKGGKKMARK